MEDRLSALKAEGDDAFDREDMVLCAEKRQAYLGK